MKIQIGNLLFNVYGENNIKEILEFVQNRCVDIPEFGCPDIPDYHVPQMKFGKNGWEKSVEEK